VEGVSPGAAVSVALSLTARGRGLVDAAGAVVVASGALAVVVGDGSSHTLCPTDAGPRLCAKVDVQKNAP
jgi:hypothetical protein